MAQELDRRFEMLTEKEAARVLKMHPDSLRRWRKRDPKLPYYTTLTGRIYYRLEDLVKCATPKRVEREPQQ